VTDEQFEEWCASLTIIGQQAFLPSEAHVAATMRRESERLRPQRRARSRDWRRRQKEKADGN